MNRIPGMTLTSIAAALAPFALPGLSASASANSGPGAYEPVLNAPIAGVRNNYWYDYRSDVEEAENELRKDLKRARKPSDRREAYAEYNRELFDARKDYRKEMVEKGYARRGEVIVED